MNTNLPATDSVGALAGLDLASLVWASDVVIAVIADDSGVIAAANRTFHRLAGRDPRGSPTRAFVSQGQQDAFSSWLADVGPDWSTRTWGMLPGDDGMPRDISLAACRWSDEMIAMVGEPIATQDLTAALLDVNETVIGEQRRLFQETERLDRVSLQDALTGVANRRAFDEGLARHVAPVTSGLTFALVIVDIDHFKAVNDRYGHPTGDAVLRWLGGLLRAATRQGDIVARYGGEEFAAILPGADAEGATRWAERLRRAVRDELPPGVDTGVTISAGVAVWALNDDDGAVVARADRALYAAKHGGRDRVVTDGVDPPVVQDEPSELPTPVWSASAIGAAIVEGTTIRRVNGALARLIGRQPDELPVGSLVHPNQVQAFTDFVLTAGAAWSKALFGFHPDTRGVPLDHVTWARRRGGTVELLIEPAAAETAAVDQTMLALVDEMIEVQHELEHRTKGLERALADKVVAEQRVADLKRLLPICAWCGQIRREDTQGSRWMPIAEYLDGEGIEVTHSVCDTCDQAMSGTPAG